MNKLWIYGIAAVLAAPAVDARANSVSSLTVGFVENLGQHAEPARFVCRTGNLTTWLTADSMITQAHAGTRGANVALGFDGASADVDLSAEGRRPGVVHFLRGDRPAGWVTDLAIHGAVRYAGLYDGIDLVIRERGGQLEYDFELAPGADPSQIRVRCDGAEALRLGDEGELILDTAVGALRHGRPDTFRVTPDGARVEVDARFVQLDARTFGFEVAGWDGSDRLVIDPVMSFTSFLGGSDSDQLGAVALHDDGSIYAAGQTLSLDFPTTTGAFDEAFNGSGVGADDVIVARFAPEAAGLVYATYIGGTDGNSFLGEFASDIAVDATGAAFVVGTTSASDFPTTAGALKTSLDGTRDGFVLKLDPTGASLAYSTYLGGSNADNAVGVAIDATGNAYITGHTASGNFPLSANAFDTAITGTSPIDGFISVIDPTGASIVYSSFFGAEQDDLGSAVAIDAAGFAYVTGATDSNEFITTAGALSQNSEDSRDIFALKVDPFGPPAPALSTVLGGTAVEGGNDIAVDDDGNIFVVGGVRSADFTVTPGAFDEIFNGGSDAYVAKLNPTATGLIFSTYLGGTGSNVLDEQAFGVAIGSLGDAIVVGRTDSGDFPTVGEGVDTVFAGFSEGFVTRLAVDGSGLVSSSYLGGSFDDNALDIAINGESGVIVGQTSSADLAATAGVVQDTFGGGFSDAFVSGFTVGCEGGFEVFGNGCPGAGGIVPTLSGDGCPDPGGEVTITVANGKPSALSAIFLGVPGGPPLDLGGCFLQIGFLTPIIVIVPLNAAGGLNINNTVPANASPGTVNFQVLIQDDATPIGLSSTNPMSMQIGDG